MSQLPVLTDDMLERDLICTTCGYNLRGLAPTGRCPECGKLIAQSLQGDSLLQANWRWVRSQSRALLILMLGSALLAAGTFFSMTPWPETALLAIGVTGPRTWLPACSRQICGVGDPRETFTLSLSAAGLLCNLFASWWITFAEPGRPLQNRRVRICLRACVLVSLAFLAHQFLHGRERPKFWGRNEGLLILAALEITHVCLLYRLLNRLAARLPQNPLHIFGGVTLWILLITYPTGMFIFFVAIAGLISIGFGIVLYLALRSIYRAHAAN